MQRVNWYRAGFLLNTTLLVGLLLASFSLTDKTPAPEAAVGNDAFIGEIVLFAGNFAPRGWAKCEGQLLPISQHQALFSILGTTYGGDGRTTFALPDLRGRVPIQAGQGPGLPNFPLGSKGGSLALPAKTITLSEVKTRPGASNDANDFGGRKPPASAAGGTPAQTTEVADPNVPNGNVQPFTTVNYIIALQGTYPSRS
jgi:microcystin-dependent protein